MATVRRLAEDEWISYREVRLRALADAPDAFGSTLARERDRSDSEWRERVSHGARSDLDLPLVLVEEDRFVGLAWGKILPEEPGTAHVFQMWVAPEHRRRGHARALLERIVSWAGEAGAERVVLSVTVGATAAERLYRGTGFEPVGPAEPLRPGSRLRAQAMCRTLG